MNSKNPTSKSCTICREFVASLEKIYESEKWKIHQADKVHWSFEDEAPVLPRLAASAKRGCLWCLFLDPIISRTIPRSMPFCSTDEAKENTITLNFNFYRSNGYPGLLGSIRSFRLQEDTFVGPYRANNLEIHVIDSSGET